MKEQADDSGTVNAGSLDSQLLNYGALARPFEWTFTQRDLAELLEKVERQLHCREEAA
jgi:hypothetical protein